MSNATAGYYCDNCENSMNLPSNTDVHSCTPKKADGTRDSLHFCTEGCYEEYHEVNYSKDQKGMYAFKEPNNEPT
mgnify:CR=1 FL=1|tara:strand:+ start:24948 stop:25172 length:225 start_codon:yes stop_codon:yes gene_type:complete